MDATPNTTDAGIDTESAFDFCDMDTGIPSPICEALTMFMRDGHHSGSMPQTGATAYPTRNVN